MAPAMHSRRNRLLARGTSAVLLGIGALAYLLLAAVAGERAAEGELHRGLAAFAWVSAAFGFTGMDLYGPGTLFRLHVLSEALLPAAATHLLLACWDRRLARRAGVLPLVYSLALALAAGYEFFACEPAASSPLHHPSHAPPRSPALAPVLTHALP